MRRIEMRVLLAVALGLVVVLRAGALLSLTTVVSAASDKDGPPVPILVQTGTAKVADEGARKAMKKQLIEPASAAGQAWTKLHIDLNRMHGNKREKWPVEAQQQFDQARTAAARSELDWLYLPTPQQQLNDSADDLRKKLSGQAQTPLAGGKETAVWVITPVGRYNFGMNWCTVLDVAPGGAAERSAALAALSKRHEERNAERPDTAEGMAAVGYSGSYNAPTEQDPRALIGICGQGMRWKAAAGAMEWVAKDLAKRYREATPK